MKKMISFIFMIVVIITALCYLACNGTMKYDNTKLKEECITITYSPKEIDAFRSEVLTSQVTYSEFKCMFRVQCLRKTHQGYYAILLQDDLSEVFVFIDAQKNIRDVIVFDKVRSEIDYQWIVLENTTLKEILTFDMATILLPISSTDMTAHIVQEGVLLIQYERLLEGELLFSPIVKSVQLIENNEIPASDDSLISMWVPFILDIDK